MTNKATQLFKICDVFFAIFQSGLFYHNPFGLWGFSPNKCAALTAPSTPTVNVQPLVNLTVTESAPIGEGADDAIHYYVAYFTGGPFEVKLVYPDSQTTEIQRNDTFTIGWNAPEGARNTCSLYVDLSINGGSSWTPIVGPIPYNYNLLWAADVHICPIFDI